LTAGAEAGRARGAAEEEAEEVDDAAATAVGRTAVAGRARGPALPPAPALPAAAAAASRATIAVTASLAAAAELGRACFANPAAPVPAAVAAVPLPFLSGLATTVRDAEACGGGGGELSSPRSSAASARMGAASASAAMRFLSKWVRRARSNPYGRTDMLSI
jgi:hypothetical protein